MKVTGGNVRGTCRGHLIRNSLIDNLAFLDGCASAQLGDNVATRTVVQVFIEVYNSRDDVFGLRMTAFGIRARTECC